MGKQHYNQMHLQESANITPERALSNLGTELSAAMCSVFTLVDCICTPLNAQIVHVNVGS